MASVTIQWASPRPGPKLFRSRHIFKANKWGIACMLAIHETCSTINRQKLVQACRLSRITWWVKAASLHPNNVWPSGRRLRCQSTAWDHESLGHLQLWRSNTRPQAPRRLRENTILVVSDSGLGNRPKLMAKEVKHPTSPNCPNRTHTKL